MKNKSPFTLVLPTIHWNCCHQFLASPSGDPFLLTAPQLPTMVYQTPVPNYFGFSLDCFQYYFFPILLLLPIILVFLQIVSNTISFQYYYNTIQYYYNTIQFQYYYPLLSTSIFTSHRLTLSLYHNSSIRVSADKELRLKYHLPSLYLVLLSPPSFCWQIVC